MGQLVIWIKRILAVGILEFLAKLSLRAWGTALLAIAGVVALFIFAVLILIALLF